MRLISVRNADIIYEILSLASWIRSIIMPKDSSTHKFTSSQMIPQDAAASKLKLSKVSARYIELSEFAGSDLHRGYFCYNCVYFMKPNHCSSII